MEGGRDKRKDVNEKEIDFGMGFLK